MTASFKINGTIARIGKLEKIRNTYRLQVTLATITPIENGREKTEYTNIILWDRIAQAADRNLRKNSKIFVQGSVSQVPTHKGTQTYLNVRWIKYLANYGGPREVQLALPLGA